MRDSAHPPRNLPHLLINPRIVDQIPIPSLYVDHVRGPSPPIYPEPHNSRITLTTNLTIHDPSHHRESLNGTLPIGSPE